MKYKKDEDFSIGQLIVGLIILAIAGYVIWGVFSGDESVTPISQSETVTEEVTDEQPAEEPIVEIVKLYNTPMSQLSDQFDTSLNSVGNLVFDNDDYELLVESKNGNTPNYVEVQIKSLGSCTKAGVSKNSDNALELVGLKPHLKGNPTNPPAGVANGAIEYCEYPNTKFAPGVSCAYEGGYYDVSLSPRTFCSN
jgi:hypothetical protein